MTLQAFAVNFYTNLDHAACSLQCYTHINTLYSTSLIRCRFQSALISLILLGGFNWGQHLSPECCYETDYPPISTNSAQGRSHWMLFLFYTGLSLTNKLTHSHLGCRKGLHPPTCATYRQSYCRFNTCSTCRQ